MVIETTTFRLADGGDEAAYLEFDEKVRTGFLYHQPGIVRATTARGDDGEWIVVVIWASEEAADAALDAGTKDGTMQQFLERVDGAERKRYSTFD
jgi:heme-degrading monooxygenase HmoA